MSRATGYMYDPPADPAFLPVPHGKTAQLGRCGEVYSQGIFPSVEPFDVGCVERHRLEQARIVHQHVDLAARTGEGGLPKFLRRPGFAEIDGHGVDGVGRSRLADHPRAPRLEGCLGCGADSTARSGEKDACHAPPIRKIARPVERAAACTMRATR